MIERLQRIASHLRSFRTLLVLIAVACLCVLALSVLDNPWITDDGLLIPAILGVVWAVTLISFTDMFAQIPQAPPAGASWRARLAYRMRRGTRWLLGLLVIALCLVVVVLSYQLLRVGSVG